MKCPKCQFENPSNARFCANCTTPLSPSEEIPVSHTETLQIPQKELTIGSTFAERYQVLEELGQGGMGTVYKVLDKEIDEKVALKLLKPEVAADERTIKRFRNELKFARRISHKNVCRMYHISKEEGTHYITMEYVPGEDLKSLVNRTGRFSTGKAVSIAKQVCEGLAEAHKLGVVHRDLKPQNIMIDRDENARIMDFGIARSVEAKGVTEEGLIIGTPDYMSPEQVEGREADQRADLYSLGVILYEMVTGKVPFEGDSALSVALKHKTEVPKDPKEIDDRLSDDLSQVILRCLEKDREMRYQTAEELLSELRNIEEGIPLAEKVIPKRKPKVEKISRIKWRNSLLYSGAALLLILLVVGGVSIFTGRAEAIDSLAVLPFENADADPNQEELIDGITVSLINQLSQFSSLKKVISSFSVFQYKGKKPDLQSVGQKLKVRAVLTGRISQRGDDLSISAELVDTQDNSVIWGGQYNRKFSEIFAIQEEISREISEKLRLRLTREEKERLAKRYTENIEAYKAYLKGDNYLFKWAPKEAIKAIKFFQEAIESDPLYAPAYAGTAAAYSALGMWGILPPKEAYQKANAAAVKALEIDDTLARAHASLANVKMLWDWDWESAEEEIKRALELNPNSVDAHFLYGEFYTVIKGDMEKALEEKRRAQELDPLLPLIDSGPGITFFYFRQYDQAIEELERLLAMGMDYWLANFYLWQAYESKEMYDKAFLNLIKALEIMVGNKELIDVLKNTYERSGYNAALRDWKNIRALSDKGSVTLAGLCARLGEKDEALEWLEKAYEQHDPVMFWIRVHERALDSLHSHPRFKAILKKMNLE
jgi:serine/threonine protein kinase